MAVVCVPAMISAMGSEVMVSVQVKPLAVILTRIRAVFDNQFHTFMAQGYAANPEGGGIVGDADRAAKQNGMCCFRAVHWTGGCALLCWC